MLVIIPARGGSKGIPGKNIKKLNGKPLIEYTLKEARKVFEEDQIMVSTDDMAIKETVERWGQKVPFLRPPELATDNSSTQEVILHILEYVNNSNWCPETIMVLQPTSPFRKARHIREAIKLYSNKMDMLASVKETTSNPYYLLKEENKEGYLENSKIGNFTRRQDCPKVWELNGAIYMINVESLKAKPISEFKKVGKYVMDAHSSLDIDEEIDWVVAEYFMTKQISK